MTPELIRLIISLQLQRDEGGYHEETKQDLLIYYI